MIDVYDLYKDFCSRVNTFQGGNFRLEEDYIRNVNAIYFDIWNRETRNARKSQESKDNVVAFLVSKNILIPKNIYSRYGIVPLPKDYGRFSSARVVIQLSNDTVEIIPDVSIDKGKCFDGRKTIVVPKPRVIDNSKISENPIDLIDDNQWAGCLSHETKSPTLLLPKMVQIDGVFQVAPKEVSVIVFSYYTMPKPAVVNVTYTTGDDQNGNGDEKIYNANKSTQILLPYNLKNEFLWRLGEIYGYYTREQFLALFSNEKLKP